MGLKYTVRASSFDESVITFWLMLGGIHATNGFGKMESESEAVRLIVPVVDTVPDVDTLKERD